MDSSQSEYPPEQYSWANVRSPQSLNQTPECLGVDFVAPTIKVCLYPRERLLCTGQAQQPAGS